MLPKFENSPTDRQLIMAAENSVQRVQQTEREREREAERKKIAPTNPCL